LQLSLLQEDFQRRVTKVYTPIDADGFLNNLDPRDDSAEVERAHPAYTPNLHRIPKEEYLEQGCRQMIDHSAAMFRDAYAEDGLREYRNGAEEGDSG